MCSTKELQIKLATFIPVFVATIMAWLLGPLLAVIGFVTSEPAGRSLSSSSHSYRFVSPPVFPTWKKTGPVASRRMAEGDSSELAAFYYPLQSREHPGETRQIRSELKLHQDIGGSGGMEKRAYQL